MWSTNCHGESYAEESSNQEKIQRAESIQQQYQMFENKMAGLETEKAYCHVKRTPTIV